MRLVAEIGLVALAREPSLGVARIDAAALIRTPDRAGDEGRVDQRAALDDEPRASSCRLTSAKSFVDRPSLSIIWRNRQIEAWSSVSMSNGRP